MKIVKKAYGKINLTLEVGQLNPIGLHPLKSIMQSIALHDTLTFESRTDSIIELRGNRDDLSYGDDNLIIKAAKLFREVTGVVAGVSITLNKQISIAAGLGGGSSDAAATLLALNVLWGVEWPIGKLVVLGSRLGSDVPFCIIGGTCFVEGTGEKVRPISSLPKTSLFVVKPEFGVSTRTVYEGFDKMYKNHEYYGFSEKWKKQLQRVPIADITYPMTLKRLRKSFIQK